MSFKIRNCDRLLAKVRRQPPHIGAGRDIGIEQQPRAFVIVQRADGNIRLGGVVQQCLPRVEGVGVKKLMLRAAAKYMTKE